MDTITPPSGHNLPPVLSVSEISSAVRRKVEEFGTVRVRGEISQPRVVGSGHCYLRLKDAEAVLEAVIWRSVLRRITLAPEDGMEVICTGRITTYPGKSTYQIVVDAVELAGEGALLKMIEERRRRLAAEGLFDAARKRPLPYLPEVIGVVTSPTGAVIRDILHRLDDRFPRRVLLWPVAVQGEGAAEEIAAALRGFVALPMGGPAPRPDLVIVARGGGSLEDLMAFNEEAVVRAVAECTIPIISAVGHETDTTLIDHAADRRAPTPSAAAEMAVPVRTELVAQVADDGSRMVVAITRRLREQGVHVGGLARGLPDPARLIGTAVQSLDDRGERLRLAVGRLCEAQRAAVDRLAYRLPAPRERIERVAQRLEDRGQRLALGGAQAMDVRTRALDGLAVRLRRPDTYLARDRQRLEAATSRIGLLARKYVQLIRRDVEMLAGLDARLGRACGRAIDDFVKRLDGAGALLESISYQRVLDRGFVLVKDAGGRLVTSAEQVRRGQDVVLRFRKEAEVAAVIAGPVKAARDAPRSREKTAAPSKPAPEKTKSRQGRLL